MRRGWNVNNYLLAKCHLQAFEKIITGDDFAGPTLYNYPFHDDVGSLKTRSSSMNAHALADQIYAVLRQNGYPKRKVRIRYLQIYRPAVDNGFALEESLGILKRVHRVDCQRVDDRMVFYPIVNVPAQCDWKIVEKAIRRDLQPVLDRAGFMTKRGRNWWRTNEVATWVLNVRSFNAHQASLYGCTTFSFSIHVGIYFHDVGRVPWFDGEIPEYPKESDCHLRMSPKKPADYVDDCELDDIWCIKPNGSNIDETLGVVAEVLQGMVWPWLERHLVRDKVLDRFVNDLQPDEAEVYFGSPFSPARATVVCGMLLAKLQVEQARQYLQDALLGESSPATRSLQQEYAMLFDRNYPS